MTRQIASRERQVRRVLLIEGLANLAVLVGKAVVGFSTGSMALVGDAIHSFTDLANNGLALVAVRVASVPPDREHPYGHRKFETLAVFTLATVLAVLAVEVAIRAVERGDREVTHQGWGLAVMLGVLAVNVCVSLWEGRWARRLDSEILWADAGHTLADVLVTATVIVGWQLSARGWPWLDTAFALGVAGFILFLSFRLFQRAIPVLVDRIAADPDALKAAVESVPGVRATRRVRSRGAGTAPAVDVIVTVAPDLSAVESHAIADTIEEVLRREFAVDDVTVHVEPEGKPK